MGWGKGRTINCHISTVTRFLMLLLLARQAWVTLTLLNTKDKILFCHVTREMLAGLYTELREVGVVGGAM